MFEGIGYGNMPETRKNALKCGVLHSLQRTSAETVVLSNNARRILHTPGLFPIVCESGLLNSWPVFLSAHRSLCSGLTMYAERRLLNLFRYAESKAENLPRLLCVQKQDAGFPVFFADFTVKMKMLV
ncbi:hypothetical protein [Undibacterium squillarum]|uniref:hypothetical protein n=1 Tax=Undibacterium squillarum TaxID=1131567 RepID=UPI001673ED8E|nr:hypothetical protein [Undibacterium squillarum]